MGAGGIAGRVLDGTSPSGIGLTVKSDAMWVRTESDATTGMMSATGDVSRLRLTLAADRTVDMGGGRTFTPSAEVGLRQDGGDAETGTGLEVGGRLRYAAGPLSIEGAVRTLVVHEESGYEEWGASGAIRLAPSASGRGPSLSLVPVWGNAGSATERLWSAREASQLGLEGNFEGKARLDAELGYGFAVTGTRGVVTPYTGLSLAGEGARTLRAGPRWRLAPDATLGVEGSRADAANETGAVNGVSGRTQVRW